MLSSPVSSVARACTNKDRQGLAVRAARERLRSFDARGHAPARTVADARVGENARVPAYTVNEDAVGHAKRLIDARRYVLRSRWQDVQPRARDQNAFLKTHSWEEYAPWHLGLTEGADEEAKARYALSTATSAACTGWG